MGNHLVLGLEFAEIVETGQNKTHYSLGSTFPKLQSWVI